MTHQEERDEILDFIETNWDAVEDTAQMEELRQGVRVRPYHQDDLVEKAGENDIKFLLKLKSLMTQNKLLIISKSDWYTLPSEGFFLAGDGKEITMLFEP